MFIHLGTWNVNARRPTGESIQPWLSFDAGEGPAIYALSFQEIVELSAKQVRPGGALQPERAQQRRGRLTKRWSRARDCAGRGAVGGARS